MSNQNQVPGSIPALRTYAKDLEDTRQAKNLIAKVVSASDVDSGKRVPTPPKPIREKVERRPEAKKQEPLIKAKPVASKKTQNAKILVEVDNEDAADATVITDTKKDRFRLLPSLLRSINNWFSDHKEARRRKAVPKYTVAETTRRKGVIQKATSKTGKAATADFRNLQERIKNRSEEEMVVSQSGQTFWTPDTEPGFLLLEEDNEPQVTNVVIEPRRSIHTNAATLEDFTEDEINEDDLRWEAEANPEPAKDVGPRQSEVTEPETKTQPEPEPEQTWEESVPEPEVAPTPQAVTIENEPTEVQIEPTIVEPEPETPEETVLVPVISDEEKTTRLIPPKPKRYIDITFWQQLKELNTNALALVISIVILIIASSVFVVQVLLNRDVSPEAEVAPTVESLLLNTELKLLVRNDVSAQSLISSISAEQANVTGIVQIAFVEAFPSNQPLLPSTLIDQLELNTETNLAQSTEELRFGYTSTAQPFILMKVPNTMVAQGGLLIWEKNLYSDFSKVFGLNPTSQSVSNFTDSTFAGRDVRSIKQPNGDDMLIYGIINNTVIITTNSDSYRELSILIK